MTTRNASARIHVETFEVGLGASMLLQFRTEEQVIRVLADGGVHSNPDRHVLDKLPQAIASFGEESFQIDLIIGTHYDGDHLRGLVPIIKDPRFTIGEVWLPPIANDETPHTGSLGDADLLALQFAGEGGDGVLAAYLQAKAELCTDIARAEAAADELDAVERTVLLEGREWQFNGPGDSLGFFEAHIASAHETMGTPLTGHADEEVTDVLDARSVFDRATAGDWMWRRHFFDDSTSLPSLVSSWAERRGRARTEAISLAHIRKSEAKKAINATHLANVVEALKARSIKIRCAITQTGRPRRFVWEAGSRRFIPAALASSAIELTLLGPSSELVKKHRDKLPIGTYASFLAREPLPVKHTTPSNELSYVALFTFKNQNILISGDTGFVDFRPERTRDYYQPLLEKLDKLHVIQVAHHAGANAYFYDALRAAGFPRRDQHSYLVISHGVNDPDRPSSVFGRFIEEIRNDGYSFSMLFTSQPLDKWVRDFKTLVDPATRNDTSDRGDVRLVYDGSSWAVQRHCIVV